MRLSRSQIRSAASILCCIGTLAAHAEEPVAVDAGAYLDRALAQCLNGNRVQAEEIFAYIEQNFSPPAGIRQLIELVRSENCQAASTFGVWLPDFIAVQAGRTSNANQGPTLENVSININGVSQTLPLDNSMRQKPDNFLGLEGSKTLRWDDTRLALYGSVRQFETAHDFDQIFINSNASHSWRLGAYTVEASLSASAMEMGGSSYYRSQGIGGAVRRQDLLLEAMSMRSRYPVNPVFDASVSQLRFGWDPGLANGWRLHTRFGLLFDQAENTRPGGTRRGFISSLSVDIPLQQKQALEVAARFDHTLSAQPYFSGLFDMRRDQRFSQLSATYSRPLDDVSSLEFSIKAINSADSVPFLAYRQYTAQVSWVRSLR